MEKSGRFVVSKTADVPDIDENGKLIRVRIYIEIIIHYFVDRMNNSDANVINEKIPLQTQSDVSVKFNESIFEVRESFSNKKKTI